MTLRGCMIEVIGERECRESVVETDPWIPMKITWLPRATGQPMYLRISGIRGGEVELKIDPATGALVQMIVINAPPQAEVPAIRVAEKESPSAVPIINTSMMCGESTELPSRQDLSGSVVAFVAPLAFESGETYMRLSLGDTAPVKFLKCGKACVGISETQELVSFEASL